MKITGELLKSERIRLKLSQQDIAFALKLSPRIINAIEEGDLDSLPARTFVRGFVKSYAEMLKLDSTMVLNQYHEEMGTSQPSAKIISPPSENAKAKNSNFDEASTKHTAISTVTPNLKMNLNRKTMKVTFAITVLVIALGVVNEVVNRYQKEGSHLEPQKLSVETINQEVNAPIVTTTPEPSAEPLASESPAAVAITTPNPSPTATPTAVAASGKSIELVLEAAKDTSISYATGSEPEFKTLSLKKDAIQIIKSKTGLRIKLDEGNAVSITINGISKGLASDDEKPLELSF